MKFCSNCGAPVALRIPPGDNLPRHVCGGCGLVHYQNPKMVVGSIPDWDGKILLCKRAIEPRYGLWTLPAGFMENGETMAQGAVRETLEEAKARVTLDDMFTVLSVPHINQVHIFYRARLLDLDFAPGTESLDVALFEESAIPWGELAFRTIAATLKHYYEDRKQGRFGFHTGEISPPPA